jgi:predicted GTPase
MSKKIIIMGAAGRDFHNFNVYFENNLDYEVIGFTAADQIPGIPMRCYKDIPIYPESDLEKLVKISKVEQVILAYSDLSHQDVMTKASLVLSCGADFRLMGPETTMLKSSKPVISVCAVRTGCGKSSTTKLVADLLRKKGLNVVIVRHPMPYGNLEEQTCQRFATYEDLNVHKCTIEEREEYEQYVNDGFILYAGVDYESILACAELEADIILFDGGNNDIPFFKPDYHIVIADPLRAGNELMYYPGQVNLRMANMVIINKCDSATKEDIDIVEKNIKIVNDKAIVVRADSIITVDKPQEITGKIIIVEDGPTLTHGNMSFGAGWIYFEKCENKTIDITYASLFAIGSIKETFKRYPHLHAILPAMGYSKEQIKDLEDTINNSDADVILSATPIDLSKVIKTDKPIVRVTYKINPEPRFYEIIEELI